MERQRQPNVQLRAAREMRNWTLKEAARELCLLMLSRGEKQTPVTLQVIYRWEAGWNRPSTHYRRYLCLLYGMRPDELGFLPEEFTSAGKSAAPAAVDTPQKEMPLAANGLPLSPSEASRQAVSPVTEDDLEALNLTRRHLLAASGLLSAAAGIESATDMIAQVAEPLERAARIASGHAAADDALIADLADITSSYERACQRMPGGLLVEPVQAHLATMEAVLKQSLLPEHREALLRTASQTASLMSTISLFDMNDQTAARRWLSQSVQMAEETTDPSMHVLGLVRAAELYTESGQGTKSLQLLEPAQRLAERKCSANAKSWVLASQADAHAKLRQAREVSRLLDLAAEAQQRSQPGNEPSWTDRWGRHRVAAYTGSVNLRLERPGLARAAYSDALAEAPSSAVKRRSIYLVKIAITYAQELEIGKSCELAGKALDLAGPKYYQLMLEPVGGLRRRLAPYQTDRAVKDLDERLRAVGAAAT